MLFFWNKDVNCMEYTTIFRDKSFDKNIDNYVQGDVLVAVRDADLLDFKNSKYFNDYEEVVVCISKYLLHGLKK